ncbi:MULTISPECIES: EAL domain-containing protein [unclassified Roseofilum]|uniref:EAL domain-containing response regulator n=1 Tax=unclassified Roseofilum TaxID=2620099 RepID=UPI000E901C00|nr:MULTISPECIES: EAL domain-containing protein [unclassified Roseofilum]MBP0008018.1 EAL domain-containing protein [Roseofilum sp. Belize Diploria]MBP0033363.1 EAL domain-containing protein [Roseofilum sp. Belize BBD 4]HBR00301.1 GGDEF domain-containing response regulator [Cyanobacteria bacterium UBA11691]
MAKILVIEDDEAIRENVLELLESEGYEVLGAENGREGLKIAQNAIPDLILCDVMMPELTGYAVLTTLQENPALSHIPFIFLTAKGDRLDFRYGMELGADDYLMKPCLPNEILRAVAARLDKKASLNAHYLQELQRQASEDLLTHLPNRTRLRDLFQTLVQNSSTLVAGQEQLIPVLCIGLDRFERINHTLGYDVGDRLLQVAAQRIWESFDPSTSTILARLSDDVFVAILGEHLSRHQVMAQMQTLLEQLSQPFAIEEENLVMTASIGITYYPRDGQDINPLIQNASRALNQAREQGGNKYQFYIPTFYVGSSDRLNLEADLRYALERQELDVHYQPQVSLHTGNVIGAEALIRWQHPERGWISPAKFIPIAEETGLIDAIGKWVLVQACKQGKNWQQFNPNFQVSVNLSPRQLTHIPLRQWLLDTLISMGYIPGTLELELTENALVEQKLEALKILNSLKSIGVKLALDDFGTGYSSLEYLKDFPFDTLKIDRCFIKRIEMNMKQQSLVAAIIKMSHSLDLQVVAEGVETEPEVRFLQAQNCEIIQGYYFSQPLGKEEFEAQILNPEKRLPKLLLEKRGKDWDKYIKD